MSFDHPLHAKPQLMGLFRISVGTQTDVSEVPDVKQLSAAYTALHTDLERLREVSTVQQQAVVTEKVQQLWTRVMALFRYQQQCSQRDLDTARQAYTTRLAVATQQIAAEAQMQQERFMRDYAAEHDAQIRQQSESLAALRTQTITAQSEVGQLRVQLGEQHSLLSRHGIDDGQWKLEAQHRVDELRRLQVQLLELTSANEALSRDSDTAKRRIGELTAALAGKEAALAAYTDDSIGAAVPLDSDGDVDTADVDTDAFDGEKISTRVTSPLRAPHSNSASRTRVLADSGSSSTTAFAVDREHDRQQMAQTLSALQKSYDDKMERYREGLRVERAKLKMELNKAQRTFDKKVQLLTDTMQQLQEQPDKMEALYRRQEGVLRIASLLFQGTDGRVLAASRPAGS